jgi:hypothetical protein
MDSFLAGGRCGFAGHVDALASDVVLPAVVHTAQTVLLVARPVEGGAPVGADLCEETDFTRGVAEEDEILVEQLDAVRFVVRLLEVSREVDRHPVLPHEVAHGGAGADVGQYFVISFGQHVRAPVP